MISSKDFIAIAFRYIIHLELTFVYGVMYIFCLWLLFQDHLLKRSFFSTLNCIGILVKTWFIINIRVSDSQFYSFDLCLFVSWYHTVPITIDLRQFLNWKVGIQPYSFQDYLSYSRSLAFLHEFQGQLAKSSNK